MISASEPVNLREAIPRDSPHLLVWDAPSAADLEYLIWQNGAHRISYRQDLLYRLPTDSQVLAIDYRSEIKAIRALGCQPTHPIVLLEDLDYLLSYLYTCPDSPITTFWYNLQSMRHLQSLLWILLPSAWVPSDWDTRRLLHLSD